MMPLKPWPPKTPPAGGPSGAVAATGGAFGRAAAGLLASAVPFVPISVVLDPTKPEGALEVVSASTAGALGGGGAFPILSNSASVRREIVNTSCKPKLP